MTELELLRQINKDFQEHMPDLFDSIMQSAREQGLMAPSKPAKSKPVRAKKSKAKIVAVSVIAALAVTAAVGAGVGIALAIDSANGSNQNTSQPPVDTPNDTPTNPPSDNPDVPPVVDDDPPIIDDTHQHNMKLVEYQQATCQHPGNIEYYICDDCENWYYDEEGESEITDYDSVIIPQESEHNYVDSVCSWCGTHKPTEGLIWSNWGTYYEVRHIGSATDKEIFIPETYQGLPVTSINTKAFADRPDLKSITIPDSVTYVGMDAFRGSTGLIKTEGNGLQYVGNFLVGYSGSVALVTVKEGTKGIVGGAFRSCKTLTGITIPSGVTYIGTEAFYECEKLSNITIPNTVTSIEQQAFYFCKALKSVTLPNSLTTVGNGAFWGSGLTSVTLPNSVTFIDSYAFAYCSALTSITIPNSVTYIGACVFQGSKLTNINFNGTTQEWAAIQKEFSWSMGSAEFTVTCTNGTLNKSEA